MVGDSVAQPVARDMTPVPLRVPALEVVDDDGRVRARLGLGPDGALASTSPTATASSARR